MVKDKPLWCLPLPSVCLPLINMHKDRVNDVTHCYNLGKSAFLHTNFKCLPLCVYVRVFFIYISEF